MLGVTRDGKHARTEPCWSVEGQSCNMRELQVEGLWAAGWWLSLLTDGPGPSEHAVPHGPSLDDAPQYLKLGHIRGGAGPSIRAVLDAPGLIILAGAPLAEIPGEHQALSF